jgi:hypothetical protein
MIGQLVQTRGWDESRRAPDEREWLEDEVSGISRGPPKADRNAPVGRFEGDPSRNGARSSCLSRPSGVSERRLLESGGRVMYLHRCSRREVWPASIRTAACKLSVQCLTRVGCAPGLAVPVLASQRMPQGNQVDADPGNTDSLRSIPCSPAMRASRCASELS